MGGEKVPSARTSNNEIGVEGEDETKRMAFRGGGGLLNALCVIEWVSYLVLEAFPFYNSTNSSRQQQLEFHDKSIIY